MSDIKGETSATSGVRVKPFCGPSASTCTNVSGLLQSDPVQQHAQNPKERCQSLAAVDMSMTSLVVQE